MGAHYVNVAPRYTAGSPAPVSPEIADQVAEEERERYQFVLDGLEGPEQQAKAQRAGLALIVFEMVEVPKGWWVLDWLTDEMHFWPHQAMCPWCKRKKVPCRRGVLEDHGCSWANSEPVVYVGRTANVEERQIEHRRFYKQVQR